MKTFITLFIGSLSLTETKAEAPNPEIQQAIAAEKLAFDAATERMFKKATLNAKSKYVFVTDPRACQPVGHLVEVASKKSVISFSGNFLWQAPFRKNIAAAISKNENMLVAETLVYKKAKHVIQLTLWDTETRKIVKTFPGIQSSLLRVSFSDNNKEIIGKATNGKTMTWNVASGKIVK